MQLLACKKSDYYSSHCSGRETLHDGQKFLLETLARKSCKCWWIHKRVILDNRTGLQMQRPINHEIMSTVNCNLECVHMCLCGCSNPFLSVSKVSLPHHCLSCSHELCLLSVKKSLCHQHCISHNLPKFAGVTHLWV